MFDIGGYELILLAVVAILVVGPKELPGMLRSVGRFVTQARQMTSNVQRQFNDALKEAELDDVKKTIDDVRSLNPATKIRQTIAKEMQPLTDVSNSVKNIGKMPDNAPTVTEPGVPIDKSAAKSAAANATTTNATAATSVEPAQAASPPPAASTVEPAASKPATPTTPVAASEPAQKSLNNGG